MKKMRRNNYFVPFLFFYSVSLLPEALGEDYEEQSFAKKMKKKRKKHRQ